TRRRAAAAPTDERAIRREQRNNGFDVTACAGVEIPLVHIHRRRLRERRNREDRAYQARHHQTRRYAGEDLHHARPPTLLALSDGWLRRRRAQRYEASG